MREPLALQPRPGVAAQHVYSAGVPAPSEAGSLAANETPWGASPTVAAAVAAEVPRLHRYPDPLATGLRAAIAEHHGVRPENVVVGAGSDEFYFSLVTAYAQGGTVACTAPRYWGYQVPPEILGATVVQVPARDWRPDADRLAEVDCDLLYVCNPSNPLGTVLHPSAIEDLIDGCRAALVVVDEAYIEFADDPGATSMVQAAAAGRCAVTRTFSKAYGLAGLRVGYLVASEEVCTWLTIARSPFPVNRLGQVAAAAALADRDHLARVVADTRANRARLVEVLERAGLAPLPSQANFVCTVTDRDDELVAHMSAHGVKIRPGRAIGLPGAVRITVPDDAGLELVAAALAAWR